MPAHEASGFVVSDLSWLPISMKFSIFKKCVVILGVDFWKIFMKMDTNFTIFPSRMNLVLGMELYLGLLT